MSRDRGVAPGAVLGQGGVDGAHHGRPPRPRVARRRVRRTDRDRRGAPGARRRARRGCCSSARPRSSPPSARGASSPCRSPARAREPWRSTWNPSCRSRTRRDRPFAGRRHARLDGRSARVADGRGGRGRARRGLPGRATASLTSLELADADVTDRSGRSSWPRRATTTRLRSSARSPPRPRTWAWSPRASGRTPVLGYLRDRGASDRAAGPRPRAGRCGPGQDRARGDRGRRSSPSSSR